MQLPELSVFRRIVSTLTIILLISDEYFSDPENLASLTCEQGVNTDASLLYKPRRRRVTHRPPWKKYWRADPGMPTITSSHSPFRETALQAPLEVRNQHHSPYICEYIKNFHSLLQTRMCDWNTWIMKHVCIVWLS